MYIFFYFGKFFFIFLMIISGIRWIFKNLLLIIRFMYIIDIDGDFLVKVFDKNYY